MYYISVSEPMQCCLPRLHHASRLHCSTVKVRLLNHIAKSHCNVCPFSTVMFNCGGHVVFADRLRLQ